VARPKQENPTPAEIEILEVIWDNGPSTVRQVMNELNKQRMRAYTTIMTLMNGMTDKEYLAQKQQGRAFVYEAKINRGKLQSRMVNDLIGKVFDGSASALVNKILSEGQADEDELEEIRQAIEEYKRRKMTNDEARMTNQ
jgi:BlaI family transcriptional regulator, penicillinase repressor